MEIEKNPKEHQCQYCREKLEWELQEVCHACVEKRHGPFKTYKYIASLNYTPKQKDEIGR